MWTLGLGLCLGEPPLIVPVIEAQDVLVWDQETVQLATPQVASGSQSQGNHATRLRVELPAKEPLGSGFCQWSEIGIIGKIFLHAHPAIESGLLREVFIPGFC